MTSTIFSAVFSLLFSFTNVQQNQPEAGTKAPEIQLKNTKGEFVKLSSLKGKLVLIDFWASWCGPCRKENPNVVEAYNKYKKTKFKNAKGFEIYSVSLDRTEEPWKKAITDDKLIWKNHVWDNEGLASKLYGVRSIPFAFLVDGKGVIIASGPAIRGLGLHIEIEKQFK